MQADVRSEHFLIRDEDGTLVGYAHLDTEQERDAGLLVAELAVRPEHRGKGAGTQLVEALLDRADLPAEPAPDTGRLRIWAHGEHPAAQCDLAGHGNVGVHRNAAAHFGEH